jgi:glycosyltransferase involved in cell wall biosynthesis
VVFSRKSEEENKFEKYGQLHRIECYPRKGKRDYLELVTRPLKLYFGIRKICRSKSFDAIHCHNQNDEWICLLAAKHSGVPIRIAHSHVTNSPRKRSWIERAYKSLSPSMLKHVTSVNVGCSKLACEQFYAHSNYIVIPNSIDLSRYSISRKDSPQKNCFVHVGRYTYAKNQEFILETFAEICKILKDAHLLLIGYGEDFEVKRLSDLIENLGIKQNVELIPGDKVDILSYYAKAEYMIFPSRFEGFGIVLIEAQAMGIKCYVSENIQKEADVGLLTFLQLSDGPEKWAEKIVSDIKNNREQTLDTEKLLQYSNESISKKYAAIYNGELSSQ